jgi:hypothetical protein
MVKESHRSGHFGTNFHKNILLHETMCLLRNAAGVWSSGMLRVREVASPLVSSFLSQLETPAPCFVCCCYKIPVVSFRNTFPNPLSSSELTTVFKKKKKIENKLRNMLSRKAYALVIDLSLDHTGCCSFSQSAAETAKSLHIYRFSQRDAQHPDFLRTNLSSQKSLSFLMCVLA